MFIFGMHYSLGQAFADNTSVYHLMTLTLHDLGWPCWGRVFCKYITSFVSGNIAWACIIISANLFFCATHVLENKSCSVVGLWSWLFPSSYRQFYHKNLLRLVPWEFLLLGKKIFCKLAKKSWLTNFWNCVSSFNLLY